MKNLILTIIFAPIAVVIVACSWAYRKTRRQYCRFCINVLWKRFQVRTSAYERWHDKRAKKLQALLDNEHSMYPSF